MARQPRQPRQAVSTRTHTHLESQTTPSIDIATATTITITNITTPPPTLKIRRYASLESGRAGADHNSSHNSPGHHISRMPERVSELESERVCGLRAKARSTLQRVLSGCQTEA